MKMFARLGKMTAAGLLLGWLCTGAVGCVAMVGEVPESDRRQTAALPDPGQSFDGEQAPSSWQDQLRAHLELELASLAYNQVAANGEDVGRATCLTAWTASGALGGEMLSKGCIGVGLVGAETGVGVLVAGVCGGVDLLQVDSFLGGVVGYLAGYFVCPSGTPAPSNGHISPGYREIEDGSSPGAPEPGVGSVVEFTPGAGTGGEVDASSTVGAGIGTQSLAKAKRASCNQSCRPNAAGLGSPAVTALLYLPDFTQPFVGRSHEQCWVGQRKSAPPSLAELMSKAAGKGISFIYGGHCAEMNAITQALVARGLTDVFSWKDKLAGGTMYITNSTGTACEHDLVEYRRPCEGCRAMMRYYGINWVGWSGGL